MDPLPQRTSLTDQVVEAIRSGLEAARWEAELPSESELCRELQISRVTLRRALEQLIREELIASGGKGRHHRILRVPSRRAPPAARTVRILLRYSAMAMGSMEYEMLTAILERVAKAGYRTELESRPHVFESFRAETLVQLDALPDTAAWVLCHSTEEIQRWFASCERPAVVVGRLYDRLSLSSIYPDLTAATRHAAGLLCARGNRDVVYLIANSSTLNERLAADTFVSESRRLGLRARIVSYDMDSEALGRVVKNLIASQPQPTGYVIGAPERSITVLCQLLAAGIRVPGAANVISMWDDHALSCTFPTMARYRTDGTVLGKQIGKSLLDLLRNGKGKVRTIPVMPTFMPGGSLGNLDK